MNDFKVVFCANGDICEQCGNTFNNKKGHDLCHDCFSDNREAEYKSEMKYVIKDKRATAKKIGAKALKGSEKQKKWAEELRKQFIEQHCSDIEIFKAYINCSDLLNAKFWIENRENLSSIEKDFLSLIEITQHINKTKDMSRLEERKAILKKLKIEE